MSDGLASVPLSPLSVASIHSRADVAQLVEHFTRNEGVRGSSPRVGSGRPQDDDPHIETWICPRGPDLCAGMPSTAIPTMTTTMSSRLAVWTIGHSNHEFDDFAQLVLRERIEFLVDVRSFPYSRFAPHFNRDEFEAAMTQRGVRYLFLGEELGGRPTHEEHYDAEGHALYGPMSEEEPFRTAVERLVDGGHRHRIALVCSEGDPRHCHRRLLVGKVLTDRGVELRHILPDGTVRAELSVALSDDNEQCSLLEEEKPWRSTQSVSHRRRLSTSSSV
jgi:Protein of unknown function, DUF488